MSPIRGPIVTLWHGDGIESAWIFARDLLTRARPKVVQLHTWSPLSVASAIKRALADTTLVCGFGIDGIARDVTKRRLSVSEGIRLFVRLAERAQKCSAIAVKWNAEAAWKRPPTSDEATLLRELVRAGLGEVAARFPSLQQWHTSYDHPTFHRSYNWADWLGPNSPIVASFPQVYAAPGDGLMAHRGALAARETRALSSWQTAIRAGWIVADDPGTALREGVVWRPYYQLHHVSARDTISSAITHECAALWAAPSRMDREGKTALLALCELHRRGFWERDGLRRFQSSAGLVADGLWGPNTARALGVA